MPCGKSQGLPVGMQLIAPHFHDHVLLQAAYAFQESVDWSKVQLQPALSAY